jgi:hypothetical protein
MRKLVAVAAFAALAAVGCTTASNGAVEIDPMVTCPPSEWTYINDQSFEGGHWLYTGPNPLCAFVQSYQVGLYPGGG